MNGNTQQYKIAFIGAGRVGTALGVYLNSKNFIVTGYYSRNKVHATNAAQIINVKVYDNIEQLITENDIVFLTVPDDAIQSLVKDIIFDYQKEKISIENKNDSKIFIHTSGVYSSEILNPLKKIGFEVCALHPLLAISDLERAVENLSNSYFCVDGTLKAKEIVTYILKETGNKLISIPSEMKSLYHGAASIISNYFVTLSDFAYQMLNKAGVELELAQKALMPLVNSTIDNILLNKSNSAALTGPIKRKDKETVLRHIEAIQTYMPEYSNFYKILGKQTLKMLGEDYEAFFADIF